MESENMCRWFGKKLMSIEVALRMPERKSFLFKRMTLRNSRCVTFCHIRATTLSVAPYETQMEQLHDTTSVRLLALPSE